MNWLIAALSIAQVAQGLVPVVGNVQAGATRSLKNVLEQSEEMAGSTLGDLGREEILMHDDVFAGRESRRQLRTERVRDPRKPRPARLDDPSRMRAPRRPRGGSPPSMIIGDTGQPATPEVGPETFPDPVPVPPTPEPTTPPPPVPTPASPVPTPAPIVPAPAPPPPVPAPPPPAPTPPPPPPPVPTPPPPPPPAPTPPPGGFTQSGDLTYYGGAGENGACSQTYVPPDFTTVAINQPQWNGGRECGTCVEGCFDDGTGKRCFKAIIDNLCPECASGDLDLGEGGDGRWDLQWKYIDCPSSSLQLKTEGGNKSYAKLKVQGGPSSATSMTCNYSGKSLDGIYTDDGFFEFNDKSNTDTFSCTGMSCTVSFSRGVSRQIEVSQGDLGNHC